MFAIVRRITLSALFAILVAAGCSDPVSHPRPDVSPYRDGDTLYSPTSDVTIAANGGRPWYVKEDYVIPEGVTVTVEPGAEIMVAGLNWIDVVGKLVAHGTPTAPIIFTSANSDPTLGQWRGLKLRNPNEGSELSYCIFTYGAFFDTDTLSERGRDAQNYRGMLAINNSSPTIRHCVVTRNQNNAVAIIGGAARPVIEYNVLADNDASAVRADLTVTAIQELVIKYNCVADNSAPSFIVANDTLSGDSGSHKVFGDLATVNANLDSCDSRFNIDQSPQFLNNLLGTLTKEANYRLESCSPCVDAGPLDSDFDPDNSPADMGVIPYSKSEFELRGRLEGNLEAATYRVSCDVVIPPGVTVVIPAGARLETTGMFNFEVYGQLMVEGTAENPVEMCPCQATNFEDAAGFVFLERGDAPSVLRHMIIRDYRDVVVQKPGVRFEHVEFRNAFESGLSVTTGMMNLNDAVVVQSCTFTNVGTQGILVDSSSAKIYNSRVSGSRGRGITLKHVDTGVEIMNTVVEACTTTAVMLDSLCNPRIVNNTLVDCGYYGFHVTANSNPAIFNNIVANTGRTGVYAWFSSTPNVVANNVWNGGIRDAVPANYTPGSLGEGNGNLSSNPLFADAEYRLQSGSPCRDAGMSDSQYNDPDGTRNDMGAWGGPGAAAGVGAGLRRGGLALGR
ncbi:MAG: right-handed parallel beta-helix repeat-containing protein [bacterium]|nr:right-handed parallel beta-helix repeat-containing protein [bacterium]